MPIIKSAKKAARQATKRNEKNRNIKRDIKLALKNFKASPTAENMKKIQSEYDKAVKKGLMKKNTASRRKSNAARLLKELNKTKTAPKKSAPKTTKTAKKAAPKTAKTTAKTAKTKTTKKAE